MEVYISVLILGLVLGAIVVFFVFKKKGDSSPEVAVINERLLAKDAQVAEFKEKIGYLENEVSSLQKEKAEESEKRAIAEERSNDIQELKKVIDEKDNDINQLRNKSEALSNKLAENETMLEEERKASQEKIELVKKAEENLKSAFEALSSEALKSNNQAFLELAKTKMEAIQETAKGELETKKQSIDSLVKPLAESLKGMDKHLRELEQNRENAYAGLKEQVSMLVESNQHLKKETSNLVTALRKPQVRGRWGEIQLKRVVEMAGMVEYCDFTEQESTNSESGMLRPDMVVKLPNNKVVVVDSKAPLDAYLTALEHEDVDMKKEELVRHSRQIKDHLKKLGEKTYWKQFESSPEFVVMFLPGEAFFSAALEHDPSLIEFGVEKKVILSTPTTLIALLKAVAYGWQQEKMAENARIISQKGEMLYGRIKVVANHMATLGKQIGQSVTTYNKMVASYETRLSVTAREFEELGLSKDENMKELGSIDTIPRDLKKQEEAD